MFYFNDSLDNLEEEWTLSVRSCAAPITVSVGLPDAPTDDVSFYYKVPPLISIYD
jgi:hypothetical protein